MKRKVLFWFFKNWNRNVRWRIERSFTWSVLEAVAVIVITALPDVVPVMDEVLLLPVWAANWGHALLVRIGAMKAPAVEEKHPSDPSPPGAR